MSLPKFAPQIGSKAGARAFNRGVPTVGVDRYNTVNSFNASNTPNPSTRMAELMYTEQIPADLDGGVRNLTLGLMSIESELRDVADALNDCRNAVKFESDIYRRLNWASAQMHYIARRLREVSLGLIELDSSDRLPTPRTDVGKEVGNG